MTQVGSCLKMPKYGIPLAVFQFSLDSKNRNHINTYATLNLKN